MEIPIDLIKHIKTFFPPHPLQHEIEKWNHDELCIEVWNKHSGKKARKGTYFHKWFFDKFSSQDKIKAIKEFVKENNFHLHLETGHGAVRNYEKAIKLRLKLNIKWIRGYFRDKIKEQNGKSFKSQNIKIK